MTFRIGLSALCAVLLWVGSAQAQEKNVAGAAEAFSKAQKAELAGEFQEAASLYALADEMAPAAAALRGAARTAKQAGLNATAATHAAALLAREQDAASRSFAEEILRDTAPQLARLHVSCDQPCKVLIDGRITATRRGPEHELYARPGDRSVAASFEGINAPAQSLSLVAGGNNELSFSAPVAEQPQVAVSTPAREEPRSRHKISPWYFATAGALTLVAGGVSIWSGLKVNSAHDDYDRRSLNAQDDYDDGRKLEKRTNALIGVTGGLAAATVVLAIFTDFKGRETRTARGLRSLRLGAGSHGAALGWKGSF